MTRGTWTSGNPFISHKIHGKIWPQSSQWNVTREEDRSFSAKVHVFSSCNRSNWCKSTSQVIWKTFEGLRWRCGTKSHMIFIYIDLHLLEKKPTPNHFFFLSLSLSVFSTICFNVHPTSGYVVVLELLGHGVSSCRIFPALLVWPPPTWRMPPCRATRCTALGSCHSSQWLRPRRSWGGRTDMWLRTVVLVC